MNAPLANLKAIPDSGSVTILNHTYTWKKYDPSRMFLTKDNFGDWDTDLDVEVGLPDLFTFSNTDEWDIGVVGENLRNGAVNELGENWIDQFEALFEWFAENFPANAEIA